MQDPKEIVKLFVTASFGSGIFIFLFSQEKSSISIDRDKILKEFIKYNRVFLLLIALYKEMKTILKNTKVGIIILILLYIRNL